MASEIAKFVDPDNGAGDGGTDYTSLDAWEDAYGGHTSGDGNLVGDDEFVTANCRNTSDSVDGLAVVVDNSWITDATRNITIQSMSGYLHDGTRGTGYRLVMATAFVAALQNQVDFVTIDGLAFSNTHALADRAGLEIFSDVTNFTVKNCLSYDNDNAIADGFILPAINTILVENCVAYGNGRHGINVKTANVFHCTSCANGDHGLFVGGLGTTEAKNCYCGGNTNDDYEPADGTATLTTTTCHDSDGTAAPLGSGTTTAYSVAAGCYFTNVGAGTEDLKIANILSTLNADETTTDGISATDFQGTTRAADDPYAGAHEFVGAAAGLSGIYYRTLLQGVS